LERFCAGDAEAFVAADRLPSPLGAVGVRIYAGLGRRALVADGFSYYILAARSVPASGFPSAPCFDLQAAALRRALPTIPAALARYCRQHQTSWTS
jgi:hypothetical protein